MVYLRDTLKDRRLTEYTSQDLRRSTSRDVTFDEDSTYNKSRKRIIEDPKETEAPRIQDTTMNYITQEEDREIEEPQEPVDPPQEKNPHRKKPTSVREAIQGAERYGFPK